MLAKVVKSNTVLEYTPFSFPELGGANPKPENLDRFVVPDLSELSVVFQPEQTQADQEFKTVTAAATEVENILQNARNEAAKILAEAEANAEIIAQAAQEKAVQEIQSRFDEEVSDKAADVRAELAKPSNKSRV